MRGTTDIDIYESLNRLISKIQRTHTKAFIAADPVVVAGSVDDPLDIFQTGLAA